MLDIYICHLDIRIFEITSALRIVKNMRSTEQRPPQIFIGVVRAAKNSDKNHNEWKKYQYLA